MPSPLVIGSGAPDYWLDLIMRLRTRLAEAWRAPTVLAREISILRLIGIYLYTGEEPRFVDSKFVHYNEDYWAVEAASQVDAFVLVLLRALHVFDRMRYCPNPECPAPYFIAIRRSQKYCSDACALPAQREFKRKWWQEHGSTWRKKRARTKNKLKRKRGK